VTYDEDVTMLLINKELEAIIQYAEGVSSVSRSLVEMLSGLEKTPAKEVK
jgi:hypothetical protein